VQIVLTAGALPDTKKYFLQSLQKQFLYKSISVTMYQIYKKKAGTIAPALKLLRI